jgi:tRNA1(Val) A37 N6-methylase TrmN6
MSLDHSTAFVKRQTWSEDAFIGGRITVSQPQKGFRAGLDSVLLGAAVRAEATTLCDLGAGVGTAALVALAHNPGLHATLVELQPELSALSSANLERNGFAARGIVIACDVTAPGPVRLSSGLKPNCYDSVIANPPYFEAGGGTPAPDSGRAKARHMPKDAIEVWLRAAAGLAAADGEAVVIYPAAGLADVLAAFGSRFGAITILPLAPHPEAAATRVLVRGRKGSRAPLQLLATRPVHAAPGGERTTLFEAILRGSARLDW